MPGSISIWYHKTMAMKIVSLISLSFFLFAVFTKPCHASLLNTICNSTPYPSYCKLELSNNNQSGSAFDYGRSSMRKSLFQSQKFVNLINKYLSKNSGLSVGATRALQDCQSLASRNVEFLLSSLVTVNGTNQTLPVMKADEVQTLLSALLTNQQTCLDGLQETSSSWTIQNGISTPLMNDSKLCSISLALFTKNWVPKQKKGAVWSPPNKQLPIKNGRLLLSMSGETKAIYESFSGRKLLQTTGSQVQVSGIYTVSKDGTGNFTSINDAIAATPNNTNGSNGYFMVYIRGGIYEEYVSIGKNKPFLLLVGDGINNTIITGNRSVVDGWTTFNSATFAVTASNFIAKKITFRNTAGAIKHQAVAVRNGADLSTFYSCSFEGYQDTLYAHSLRQFYRECDVYGTVDFIFGNAAVVFQGCNMYPRLPLSQQFNAITAQGRTDPNQNTGTSIQNCTIVPAADLAPSTGSFQTYLGRPWKEYSRTVYMQSYMDGFINSAGWRDWNGSSYALSTLYYAEYSNSGPGSVTTNRVTWPGYHIISAADASNFTVSSFLSGDNWIPPTGVPYTSSL